MEKKWSPKNIALLVLVLAVWAYMGLKAFDYLGGEEEVVESSEFSAEASIADQNSASKAGYDLISDNYRDPFLGKGVRSKPRRSYTQRPTNNSSNDRTTHRNRKNDKQTTDKAEEPEEIPWPSVVFKGTIENPNTKQAVAVLVINGVEDFYSNGQSYQGVKVLSFSENSTELEFNGEAKVVSK